jgi:hypothetical protein
MSRPLDPAHAGRASSAAREVALAYLIRDLAGDGHGDGERRAPAADRD